MKRYFLASLTALCTMGIFTLAIHLDHSNLIAKNAMLRNENDSLVIQNEARIQLNNNLDSTIEKKHRYINKLKFEKL